MPSTAAHFALAYTLEQRLKFRNNAFAFGCILPDIIAVGAPKTSRSAADPIFPSDGPRQLIIPDPHYHVAGAYRSVPDLDRFLQETGLDGMMRLGYFAHLMEDRLFLEEFCPHAGLDDAQLFTPNKIYLDYSRLNYGIVQEFEIDIARTNRVLEQDFFHIRINPKRRQQNIDWINNLDPDQPYPQFINPYNFHAFIRYAACEIMQDARFRRLAHQLKITPP